jgi:hypothetical protein
VQITPGGICTTQAIVELLRSGLRPLHTSRLVVDVVGLVPLSKVRHGPSHCLALSAAIVGQVGEPDLAVLKTPRLNQLC